MAQMVYRLFWIRLNGSKGMSVILDPYGTWGPVVDPYGTWESAMVLGPRPCDLWNSRYRLVCTVVSRALKGNRLVKLLRCYSSLLNHLKLDLWSYLPMKFLPTQSSVLRPMFDLHSSTQCLVFRPLQISLSLSVPLRALTTPNRVACLRQSFGPT